MQKPRGVEMLGIHRSFGEVIALQNVDLSVRPGEIHALLGENGAGKSTLMNILAGLLTADSGVVRIDGERMEFSSPLDAAAAGIGMVHQHFMLVPTLTVAEHLALGDRSRRWLGRAAMGEFSERLRELGRRHGLQVDPSAKIRDLSVGEQQRVEILRALAHGSRFLILDEPTANLAPTEVHGLLDQLRALAQRHGTGIVVITHHLDEAIDVADRISVLRGGRKVAETTPAETHSAELARLMVGRDVDLGPRPHREHVDAVPVLELEGVSIVDEDRTVLDGIDLEVRPGEIVGVVGVEGNGQLPLEEVISGLRSVSTGRLRIHGIDRTSAGPAAILRSGVGIVASDRYRRGLIRELGIGLNMILDRVGRAPFNGRFGLRFDVIAAHGQEVIDQLRIKASGPDVPAGSLSGGHAQRVVLGRALRDDVDVLVAAQPTRGLDVGAMEFVWGELERRRAAGTAVLLISNDLDEVMALADRCIVLYRGRITGRFVRPLEREAIGSAMGGVSVTAGSGTA